MSTVATHPEYEIFDLLVGPRTTNGYPLTLTASSAGDASGICQLDCNAFEVQAALQALRNNDIDAAFLNEFGTFLFEELFADDIAELYRTSLNIARSQAKHLRIRLRIDAPELAALPWEYLYDTQEATFLAISAETALVRYVPIRLPIRPLRVNLPLRVLVILSNPRDLHPLNVAQERTLIQEALANGVARGQVALQFLEKATIINIQQAMRAFQPHVFHFVGHGLFEAGRGQLLLEDESETAYAIDEQVFREFFTGSSETRLVVLNACQSATTASNQSLVGLAPQLLQRQLSAVVAMQFPIRDSAALVFAREFYRTLALGYGVDVAISEARKGIYLETSNTVPDWGAPVLFLRAKDGQIFQVESTPAQKQGDIAPPPEPTRPPTLRSFVGRQSELALYGQMLETSGMAIIAGMIGVGKTSLAAALTRQVSSPEKIFWHSFHANEGLDVLIWKLAGFLAWQGKAELWQMLQSCQQSGGRPPPLAVLFGYVLQMMRGQNYLLCLDDFQYVAEDALLLEQMELLQPLLEERQLRLLITTRQVPNFVRAARFRALTGLSLADVRILLAERRGLALADDQINQLYNLVEGNAALLNMAIDALQATRNPARLLERLTQADNIERYLLHELDRQLSEAERQVESAVAVLEYPSTRPAIETTLAQRNLQYTLYNLCERYLLLKQEGELAPEYDQHAMLRAFYYNQAEGTFRQEIHQRAATYFTQEEPDVYKAAWHAFHGGAYVLAAQLVTEHTWSIINRGQVWALCQLLERFQHHHLSDLGWATVNLARGEVYTFLGKSSTARSSFDQAWALLAKLPEAPATQELKARVCLGIGDLLRDDQPQEALDWLQRGLAEPRHHPDVLTADLLVKLSSVQMVQGEYNQAINTIDQALEILAERPSAIYIGAQENLGVIYFIQGKVTEAIKHWQLGQTICLQTHDQFKLLGIHNNLGLGYLFSGEWAQALSTFEQSRQLAEQLGSINKQVLSHLNLGILQTRLGNEEIAEEHLLKVLDLARSAQLREYESHAHFSLADLHLQRGEPQAALPLLSAAERITTSAQITYQLPEIDRLWAETHLALGAPLIAQGYAEKSMQASHAAGMVLEEGMARRVLGQVLLAQRKVKAAQQMFTQSLNCIADRDPYEAARVKLAWAQSLSAARAGKQRTTLLQTAAATFRRLGAPHELAVAQRMLENLPKEP